MCGTAASACTLMRQACSRPMTALRPTRRAWLLVCPQLKEAEELLKRGEADKQVLAQQLEKAKVGQRVTWTGPTTQPAQHTIHRKRLVSSSPAPPASPLRLNRPPLLVLMCVHLHAHMRRPAHRCLR